MMEDVLFSIVVPVYNVESYLTETVESILPQMQQLDSSSELLLVDDGSTDASGSMCDAYAQQYPQLVRVFHKENEGLLLTRRFGFRQARGRYIINCDSDDTLESHMLQKLAQTIAETDADVILFNVNSWSPPEKTPFSKDMFTTEIPGREMVFRAFFHHAGAASMCGKCFKRSCLDIDKDYSKYYRKSFGEDTVQSAEIYTNAKRFNYINEALYNYRSGSGMTGKVKLDYFQEFTRINGELEAYKGQWDLKNFDELVAYKVFVNAARAITQTRFDRTMSAKQRKAHMMTIREHPMFCKYAPNYGAVRPQLKGSYQMLLDNLLKNRYGFIELTLRLKNLLSK